MIPLFKVAMSQDRTLLDKTLSSGFIGQGPRVDEFESLLADRFNNDNVVTVNSATSGLQLAIHIMAGDRGNNIVTTPLTCTATNFPILANTFDIKWADVDPRTCNIDINDAARKIDNATSAVMVVHWGGYPVDLDALKKVVDEKSKEFGNKIVIIEDCAHAFGSTYKGLPLGKHGNAAVFSFQAIKHLTTGDGGAIVFPNVEDAKRAKLLRWYGIDREGTRSDFRCEADIPEWGWKYHMNDINASIGIANLEIIDTVIDGHKKNAAYYDENLSSIDGLALLERKEDRESSSWLYTMYVDRRDDFTRKMNDAGIMVSRVHERNDLHSCVSDFRVPLPQLDEISKKMICIPVGWWVIDSDREYIVNTIKSGW
jgi:dTDP-4-amino-4,6-dideoxygalactose transaminase